MALQVMGKVEPKDIKLDLGGERASGKGCGLADDSVEGASGGRADDQEGLGEVQTGEDSRFGIPKPCNLGVLDQGAVGKLRAFGGS